MSEHQEPTLSESDRPTGSPGSGPSPDGSAGRNLRTLGILAAVAGLVLLGVILVQTDDGSESAQQVTSGTDPSAEAQFPWEMSEPPESLIPLEEIRSGGPPPDGIPPIDDPQFVSASEASEWLADREPVISLVHKGVAKAYPLQILTWHEIANDTIAGDPITVTFCPLCNSAVAFDRRVETTPDAEGMLGVDEAVLDFGTSGRLYRSNLVMYDRQTKSLWIQFTGRSVTGPFMGTELEEVPVQMVSWEDARAADPDVQVLSRDTGHSRNYGTNPYPGYDDIDSSPFLFDGETDGRLAAMEKVVTVIDGDDAVAYRLKTLREKAGDGDRSVIHDTVGGRDIVVFFERGTASALDDRSIADSRDVGSTGVYVPRSGEEELTFEVRDGAFVDTQTGSTWSVLGKATGGPLQGERLEGVAHDDTFWFTWSSFHPDTRIYESS